MAEYRPHADRSRTGPRPDRDHPAYTVYEGGAVRGLRLSVPKGTGPSWGYVSFETVRDALGLALAVPAVGPSRDPDPRTEDRRLVPPTPREA